MGVEPQKADEERFTRREVFKGIYLYFRGLRCQPSNKSFISFLKGVHD